MSFPARICACVLLLLPVGCGEFPLEPAAITGTWALETVELHPVPAVVVNDPLEALLYLSDTLTLEPDGSVRGERCEMRVDHVEQDATTVCITYSGRYTLRVRTLEILFVCPLSTNCLGSTFTNGTLRDDRLVLQSDVTAPALGYARLD